MRYFIAHLPKGPIEKYHHELVQDVADRFNLEVSAGYFPTHITLKAPFEASEVQIVTLKGLLESFSQEYSKSQCAASFAIKGFGHFGRYVIMLDVLHSVEMEWAVKKLYEVIQGLQWITWEKHEPLVNFHITIAKNAISLKFDDIWEYIEERGVSRFDLLMDNIALLRKENDRWVVDTIYKIYP